MYEPIYLYNSEHQKNFKKFTKLLPKNGQANAHALFNEMFDTIPIMSIDMDRSTPCVEFHPIIANDILTLKDLLDYIMDTNSQLYYGEKQFTPDDLEELMHRELQVEMKDLPNDLYQVQATPTVFEDYADRFKTFEWYIISDKEALREAQDFFDLVLKEFPTASLPSNLQLRTQLMQLLNPSIRLNFALITDVTGTTLFNYSQDDSIEAATKDAELTLGKRVLSDDYIIEKWDNEITEVTDRQALQAKLRRFATLDDAKKHKPHLVDYKQYEVTNKYDDHIEEFHVVA